jgi:hypothetical protein
MRQTVLARKRLRNVFLKRNHLSDECSCSREMEPNSEKAVLSRTTLTGLRVLRSLRALRKTDVSETELSVQLLTSKKT